MIEIAVMYADREARQNLSIQRVPVSDIHTLPGSLVLFIRVYDTEISGTNKFIAQSQGFDFYAICTMRENGKEYIMVTGWDEGTFVWKQIECRGCNERKDVLAPLSVMHRVFQGIDVSPTKWEEAIAKFDAEM